MPKSPVYLIFSDGNPNTDEDYKHQEGDNVDGDLSFEAR
jgi:hypothetical protein